MDLTYRAFGLSIRSELALPGLPLTHDEPEIQVRRGFIPAWHGEATVRYGERCRIRGQEWSVRFKNLPFTGLIRDGNSVEFEADPAQDEMAEPACSGSCTGAFLFQRGLIAIAWQYGYRTGRRSHGRGKNRDGKSSTTFALLQEAISPYSRRHQRCVVSKPPKPRNRTLYRDFRGSSSGKKPSDRFGCDSSEFRRLRAGYGQVPLSRRTTAFAILPKGWTQSIPYCNRAMRPA